MRIVWRVAKWWECGMMLLFTVGFYALIRNELSSTSRDTIHYALIPIYVVWLYVTLVMFVNRRTLVANQEGFAGTNGPLPVGRVDRIPREQIAFCYYFLITTASDDNDSTVTIDYVTGIETRDGRQIATNLDFKSADDARASASEMARVLNVDLRELTDPRMDPGDRRRNWIRGGICVAALVAGAIWEVASRM